MVILVVPGEKENKSAVLNKNPTATTKPISAKGGKSTTTAAAPTGTATAPSQNGQQNNRNTSDRAREG